MPTHIFLDRTISKKFRMLYEIFSISDFTKKYKNLSGKKVKIWKCHFPIRLYVNIDRGPYLKDVSNA